MNFEQASLNSESFSKVKREYFIVKATLNQHSIVKTGLSDREESRSGQSQ